jgi:hypothetical protein
MRWFCNQVIFIFYSITRKQTLLLYTKLKIEWKKSTKFVCFMNREFVSRKRLFDYESMCAYEDNFLKKKIATFLPSHSKAFECHISKCLCEKGWQWKKNMHKSVFLWNKRDIFHIYFKYLFKIPFFALQMQIQIKCKTI